MGHGFANSSKLKFDWPWPRMIAPTRNLLRSIPYGTVGAILNTHALTCKMYLALRKFADNEVDNLIDFPRHGNDQRVLRFLQSLNLSCV